MLGSCGYRLDLPLPRLPLLPPADLFDVLLRPWGLPVDFPRPLDFCPTRWPLFGLRVKSLLALLWSLGFFLRVLTRGAISIGEPTAATVSIPSING